MSEAHGYPVPEPSEHSRYEEIGRSVTGAARAPRRGFIAMACDP